MSLPIHFLSPRVPAGPFSFLPQIISFDQDGVVEGREVGVAKPPVRLLERIEELRVLSQVSEAGLLSSAEDAGLLQAGGCRRLQQGRGSAAARRGPQAPQHGRGAAQRPLQLPLRHCLAPPRRRCVRALATANWPAARSGMGDGAGLLERERQLSS